jgi:hypothetical protein
MRLVDPGDVVQDGGNDDFPRARLFPDIAWPGARSAKRLSITV